MERRPRWAPELRRRYEADGPAVRACRSVADAVAAAEAAAEPCVLLLELSTAPEDCLRWLGRRQGRLAEHRVVVSTDPSSGELEWALRELGSVSVVGEEATADEVAAICRRQWTHR